MDWQHWEEVETRLRTRTHTRIQNGGREAGGEVGVVSDPRRDAEQTLGQDYRAHILLSTLMLLLALAIANLP
jgi:hypothetical protein